jgi:hypothetical protein
LSEAKGSGVCIFAGLLDFSWDMIQKPEKCVPNKYKMYQMVLKYPKSPLNIPNGQRIYKHFPISSPPKFTQIGIFGLKTNRLATLNFCSEFMEKLTLLIVPFFSAKSRSRRTPE